MSPLLLLGLLVKSAVIAGLALAITSTPAVRSARERVSVLRAGFLLLLAAPLLIFALPDIGLPLLEPAAPLQPIILQAPVGAAEAVTVQAAPTPGMILTWVYGVGVLAVLGRLALGLCALSGWTRRGQRVVEGPWAETLSRLDPTRRARLVVTDEVGSPLSWGRRTILIGRECLYRPERAEAVLAHELAHLRAGDWIMLMVARLAVALFWFNPLVWRLEAALLSRAEDAADAQALTRVDRADYARTLVRIAAEARPVPALAMARLDRHLKTRITRIMTDPKPRPTRPAALAAAIAGLAAVATPLAALELTERSGPAVPSAAAVSTPVAEAVRTPAAALASAVRVAVGQDREDDWTPPPPTPPAPPLPPMPLAALAPIPPLPPAPPAPPTPPAPPAQSSDARYTITRNGVTRSYRSMDEMDAVTRREFEEAHAEGERARAQGEIARREGERARREGQRAAREAAAHAAEARARAVVAVREGERARHEGLRAAAAGLAQAQVAQREARAAMAEARVSMRSGADEMMRGAEHMREEGRKLRDPAYRAKVIAENRERGNTVTDAELIELSRTLPGQADELAASARRMREQARQD